MKKFIDEDLENSSDVEMIKSIFDTAVIRVTEKTINESSDYWMVRCC